MATEDRRGYVGGSDVPAIFGISPWKTALDLYEEKTAAEFVVPDVKPERQKLFDRGKKLEPFVLEMLKDEHGVELLYRNQRYSDPEHSWMRAEIDFETGGPELLNGEIKTVSPFAAQDWGEQQTDQIPLWYCLQVMWGLMVTRRTEAVVAALVGADDLRLYHVRYDNELAQEIRSRVVQFWQGHVVPRVPPAPRTVGDVHKMLYKYAGFTVPLDEELTEDLRCLRECKSAIKEAEVLEAKYEETIKRNLLIRAEAAGVTEGTKKFVITDQTGKRTASLSYETRKGYSVGPAEFWKLLT